jgi:hypothetical protein
VQVADLAPRILLKSSATTKAVEAVEAGEAGEGAVEAVGEVKHPTRAAQEVRHTACSRRSCVRHHA